MSTDKKEIENLLLSQDAASLDILASLLKVDYEQNLSLFLDILYEAIATLNISASNKILVSIEKLILADYQNNYKIITNSLKNIVYRISSLKIENNNEIKFIKYYLLNIIRKVNEKKKRQKHYNLYNLYYQLVFKEKDLQTIEEILKKEKDITGRKDSKGNDFLYNVLLYYATIPEEDTEEIKYFYDILILLFKYSENVLIKNSTSYYHILEKEEYQNKPHVQLIREVLSSFQDLDIKALSQRYDIQKSYREDIIREISSFKLSSDDRIFIDIPFITIDGEGATCLDDAIAMTKREDGSYNFYVAITDVPSLVPYGTNTFYDAMRRIETLYLQDEVIDLYHPSISHGICSLTKGTEKNAIVYKYHVDPDYNIDLDSMEIIKAVIRVQDTLTYDNVNKQLGLTKEESEMIEKMYYLASSLKCHNQTKEKYRQVENLLYSNALYHHSLFTDKSISANIIEESMLLVNNSLARYAKLHDLAFVYRNHISKADSALMMEINKLLKGADANISLSSREILYQNIKAFYLNAHYDSTCKGHEGLGYEHYCHATSPARRFADSYIEYLLYMQVFNQIDDKGLYALEREINEVVKHINDRKQENAKFQSEYSYLKYKEKVKKEEVIK